MENYSGALVDGCKPLNRFLDWNENKKKSSLKLAQPENQFLMCFPHPFCWEQKS